MKSTTSRRGASHVMAAALLLALAADPLCTYAGGVPTVPGPSMDCEGSVQALAMQGYNCSCAGGQLNCGGSSVKGHTHSDSANLNAMLVGGIVEGMLSSMFAPPKKNSNWQDSLLEQHDAAARAARQAEEWRQSRDDEFQAGRGNMMGAFKQLEGAQLSVSDGDGEGLDFKTLDGEMESLAAGAKKPFDTAGVMTGPVPAVSAGATPFFGDTMPETDLRLLVDPENDPRVVDLRSAVTYVVGNLEKDASTTAVNSSPRQPNGNGEPIIEPPDCKGLARKLNGFIEQRSRFNKTILLAQGQLDDWKSTNRNALVNAAKDGIEYFTGNLLESLTNRGKAAERLQMIYTRNAAKMAEEGVDILALDAKIQRLNMISSAGKVAEVTSSINDWQTFIKDGMSALIMQLNASNEEVNQILEDPKMQKYFETESPELKTLLDITKMAAAQKVFGKWVARQLPIIGGVEIGIKQLYNGTEWATSFYMMADANNINGKVMNSARSLQKRIDDTRIELGACP